MTKSQTIAKIASIGLLTVFVAMLTPSSVFESTNNTGLLMYGMAEIVQKDSMGNEVFAQTIHNQLTDEGEDYIIDQVFDTGDTAITANQRIGAICITNIVDASIDSDAEREALVSTTLENSLGTVLHCIPDTDVDDDTTSTAIIASVTFTSGTNLTTGQTITAIGICGGNDGAVYDQCNDAAGTPGLFAVVNTADVTLSGTDTVDITYTFDIISATT